MEIQSMNQYVLNLTEQRFIAVIHVHYVTMEFEMVCNNRMRKILSDLSSSIELALKNVHNSTNVESTCGDEVSASANEFIEHLKMFNELMDTRMKIKPLEILERDNYLRDSIANLKNVRDEVEALESKLEEERSRHRQIVEVITAAISEENSIRENIKARRATEMAKIMMESEAEIARIEEETSLKTKHLEMEINASKTRLADISRENLSHERELYAKRSKVERRYLAILAKYDTEVGELHRTMESRKEELSCLDERIKDVRDQLAIENVRYIEMKNEREMAIRKAFTENFEKFKKNRAAKIIQRAWKCFYERCCMRKKKKSKKKK